MIEELEQIKRILREEWDPIGVADSPGAADEYDAYAFNVFASLRSGADEASIREYLDRSELHHMGLSTNSGRTAAIARQLQALHIKRETS